MITAYAATFGHWQGWQQAYRFGVLLIFPPEPLLTQVNHCRVNIVTETQGLMTALAETAPQGSFSCTAVAYAVPEDNFHFAERKRLALAGHG